MCCLVVVQVHGCSNGAAVGNSVSRITHTPFFLLCALPYVTKPEVVGSLWQVCCPPGLLKGQVMVLWKWLPV